SVSRENQTGGFGGKTAYRIGGSYQADLTNAGIHRFSALRTEVEITKAATQWTAWAKAVGLTI
ncbi:hypothetical protein AAFM37_28840, partial [Klebsiella pneumoniae]